MAALKQNPSAQQDVPMSFQAEATVYQLSEDKQWVLRNRGPVMFVFDPRPHCLQLIICPGTNDEVSWLLKNNQDNEPDIRVKIMSKYTSLRCTNFL